MKTRLLWLACGLAILLVACSQPQTSITQSHFGVEVDAQGNATLIEAADPGLQSYGASAAPRILAFGSELEVVEHSIKLLSDNTLIIRAYFRNVTSDLTFERPFTFEALRTTNVISSEEPILGDEALGDDSVLSPGEATSLLTFKVKYERSPFLYTVQAKAVVGGEGKGSAFTVNTTDDISDVNPGDGVCETAAGNAQCSVRAAIEETNALPGADTVTVPAGTYVMDYYNSTFDITDDLTLEGESTEMTVLEGGSGPADGSLMDIYGEATVNLRQLSFFGGEIGAYALSTKTGTTVTLTDVVVRGFDGIGIGNFGNMQIIRSTLVDNDFNLRNNSTGTLLVKNSEILGGATGIYNLDEATLRVEGSRIAGNADFSIGSAGGGILNDAVATLVGSTIENNGARSAGGIFNGTEGTLTLENSVLANNSASSTSLGLDGFGGGISNYGKLIMNGTTVANNRIDGGEDGANRVSLVWGAGVFNAEGAGATITNSTFSGNRALFKSRGGDTSNGARGGGIYNGGTLSLDGVTFSGNLISTLSSFGGGSLEEELLPGGAIVNDGQADVRNTIFANSTAVSECAGEKALTSLGANLADDDSCGLNQPSDLTGTDPLLGPLADNGGPTLTHALLEGSPAIDAGQSSPDLTTDQRGVARPQGAGVDIGAFEKQ